jgi:predicted DNA-binding protein
LGKSRKTNSKGDEVMPINKDNSCSMGFTTTKEIAETIDDLSARIGITKAQFIRKAVVEMIWKHHQQMKAFAKTEEHFAKVSGRNQGSA